MSYTWITPKTDWDNFDNFEYTDYNRIRNNLLYINDMINQMYPDKAKTLDLGSAKNSYAQGYKPSEFEKFEDALESFTRIGKDVNIGKRNSYKGNEPFAWASALNRLEKCCLRWKECPPVVESVTITPSTFTLGTGETQQLTVNVTPSGAIYTVKWKSSNPSVATVSNTGLVTPVSNGTVTITATVSQSGTADKTATATGTVKLVTYVSSISASPSSLELDKDESKEITLTFSPSDADNINDWTFSVNNTNIEVEKINDNQLRVTGYTSGSTASITITCGDVSLIINVKVRQGASEIWIADWDKVSSSSDDKVAYPPISVCYIGVNSRKYTKFRIMLLPNIIVKTTVSINDTTICQRYHVGGNTARYLYLVGYKRGQTELTATAGGVSCTVKVVVS